MDPAPTPPPLADPDPPGGEFSALLAAVDEALAGGGSVPAHPDHGSLGDRLARGAACLRRIREALGPPTSEADGAERRLGDFVLVREIGRGGMGVVYEARQVSLNRRVALKVLGTGLVMGPRAVARFRREAEAAARLHHTNIVPVYATGEAGGTHFYAMEFVDGPSLDHVVRQLRRGLTADPLTLLASGDRAAAAPTAPYQADPPGPADRAAGGSSTLGSDGRYFDTVARLVAEVADALDYAHREGVIHRDVKPANLLLSPAGRLSVNDFGLARVLEEPGMTATGEFVGTPAYMPPEQITAGRVAVDHRTDVYSLGATLYELLTLRPPFPGERRDQVLAQVLQKDPVPPRRVNPKVPRDLETICLKCLEKDPARRYQSAGALAEDLRRYVHRFAITARRAGPVARARKWVRRHPALAAALGVVAVLLVGVGFFAHRAREADRDRDAARERHERELVAERRQAAIDRALAAAMGGEFDAADAATREAERLGAPAGWVRMLHGQIALHRGHPREAVGHLTQAVDLMPESVAARAMLVWATRFSGGGEGVTDEHTEVLERLQPVTPEDFLFKGQVESLRDSARALRTLDEAVTRRRSGVALLVRSWVHARHAQDAGDPAAAQAAVDDAASARALIGDNPYALVASVGAHNVAAGVCRERGETGRAGEHVTRARAFVDALEPVKDRDIALTARAFFFSATGDDAAAFAEWRRGADQGNLLAVKHYAWGLYRRGEFAKALAVCDSALGNGLEGGVELVRAYVLAELDPDAARAAFDRLARQARGGRPPYYPTLLYPTAARLLGDNAAADRLGRDLSAGIRPYRKADWGRALLDYTGGRLTDDQLLAAAGRSRESRCEGHFHIALRRLAAGDRAAARTHFRASADTNIVAFFECAWSRAFLGRLEADPAWPRVDPTGH